MASETNRWIGWVLRLIGLGIFVLAFFQLAVRSGAPGPDAVVFPGWKCASIALTQMMGVFNKSVAWPPPLAVALVIVSGWINPLIGLDLLISVFSKLRIVRRILGVVIVLCMGETWWFFSLQKVTPLIGHWMWIGGALLILLPEAMPGRRAQVAS